MNYLQSDNICNWKNTNCAKIATNFITQDSNLSQINKAIEQHMVNRFQYDYIREVNTKKKYDTDIDSIYEKKMGLCLDFAIIYAAMNRAVGIPCKIITGTIITEDNLKSAHSWNEVYLDNKWKRIDITKLIQKTFVKYTYNKQNEY